MSWTNKLERKDGLSIIKINSLNLCKRFVTRYSKTFFNNKGIGITTMPTQ